MSIAPESGCFLTGDQLEQGRLAGAVGADDADDAARRQREAQTFEQQLVAIGLGQALHFDDLAAEPLGHLDEDFRLARDVLILRGNELVELGDTRLRLGLARLGALADPLELVLDRLLAAGFLALLLLHPLGFLLEVGRVIAFVGEVFPAIELEDPADDIVEEVAVVGDHQHRAGIFLEMRFEPLDAFRVEVVGGLVEEQDRGLLDQQARQRDPALFTTRQAFDRPVRRWAAQCLHRDFELVVERPAVDRVDLALELAHLLHQLVEIGVLLGIAHLGRNGVEAVDHVGDVARSVLDVFQHGLAGVELRFLRQIADGDVLARPGLALILLVDAGHDLHQRRLAGAVGTDDADLGALVELQVDVVQHRLLGAGEGLHQVLHDISILGGHGVASFLRKSRG